MFGLFPNKKNIFTQRRLLSCSLEWLLSQEWTKHIIKRFISKCYAVNLIVDENMRSASLVCQWELTFIFFFTLHCPQPSHIVIVVLCSPAFTESLLSCVLQPPQSPCCPVFSSIHRVLVVLCSPASTQSLLSSVLQPPQSPCCPLFSSLHYPRPPASRSLSAHK